MTYKVEAYLIDHVVVLKFPNKALAERFIGDVKIRRILEKMRLDARKPNRRFRP